MGGWWLITERTDLPDDGDGGGSEISQESHWESPTPSTRRELFEGLHAGRVSAAVVLFIVAGAVAGYWMLGLLASVGDPYMGALDLAYVLAVAATMSLLFILAGLHFLNIDPDWFARWRVPAAIILALLSFPFSLLSYGHGVYAAGAALVLARRAWAGGQRSFGVVIAAGLGAAGVMLSAAVLFVAVGLCGPRILVGICDA